MQKPPPPWQSSPSANISPRTSFQLQIKIISQQIESLSNTLTANDELLSRLVVFPLPEFPTRTSEGLLAQLLRKKLEPVVEDWIQDGLTTATKIETSGDGDRQELEELWDWAPGAFRESFLPYTQVLGGNYTLEERAVGIENVVTGLKRELADNQEESDDEDEDDMKDDPKPKSIPEKKTIQESRLLPIEDQLKYMITGVLPVPIPSG